jgi:hypothetical protein
MDNIAINEFPQHASFGESDNVVISGAEEEALVPFNTLKESVASAISGDIQSGAPPVAMTPSDLDHEVSKVWLYTGTTTTDYENGYIYFWNGTAWEKGSYYGQVVEYATQAEINSIINIIEG